MSLRPDRDSRVISKDLETKTGHLVFVSAQTEVADLLATSPQLVLSHACSGFEFGKRIVLPTWDS